MSAPRTMDDELRVAETEVIRPSMALVPIAAERPPRSFVPPDKGGVSAPTVFYGVWYLAVAFIVIGGASGGWIGDGRYALFGLAGLFIAISGLCLAVYTLHRPTERKFRQGLLAGAALVAGMAAVGPMQRAGTEIRLSGTVAELQPAVDDLVRFGRLEEWSTAGLLVVSGYRGANPDVMVSEADSLARTLDDVLLRGGATRDQLNRVIDRMERAGIRDVRLEAGGVTLRTDRDDTLLYLPPGRERHPAARIFDDALWDSTPLGGGWYRLE